MKVLVCLLLTLSCAGLPKQQVPARSPVNAFAADQVLEMGEIDEDSADMLIKQMHMQVTLGAKEVRITIDSPGGEVFSGWRLSRAIENLGVPVICTVDGMAASMAFYELQSCTVRVMKKRSLLMAHGASGGARGKAKEIEQTSTFMKILNRAMAEHEASRLNISVEDFLKKTESDWWMGWSDALEVKAVDLVE